MANDDSAGNVLDVTVFIAARPETVFSFFEDHERFRAWLGAQMDDDGARFEISYPNGQVAEGEVVECRSPEKFVFVWGYRNAENGLPPRSTRVIITLDATAHGTVVRLRHEGIDAAEVRSAHRMGWTYFLGRLSADAASAALGGVVEQLVDAYVEAWNAPDLASRARLLEQCWEDDAVFKDGMTYVEGRERLNAHVEGARRHMAEASLERASPVLHTHDWIRFDWRILGGADTIVAQGTNVGRVTPEGRIREMVGFPSAPPEVRS